jgi:hypothetical protein
MNKKNKRRINSLNKKIELFKNNYEELCKQTTLLKETTDFHFMRNEILCQEIYSLCNILKQEVPEQIKKIKEKMGYCIKKKEFKLAHDMTPLDIIEDREEMMRQMIEDYY